MNKLGKYKCLYLFFLVLWSGLVLADTCPTPQIIKDRKISREHDWTIDERRTVEELLSVKRLYSVRTINNGEFIACYYSLTKGLLRLDGKPEKEACSINITSGEWQPATDGEQVCKENDLSLCVYAIRCE